MSSVVRDAMPVPRAVHVTHSQQTVTGKVESAILYIAHSLMQQLDNSYTK